MKNGKKTLLKQVWNWIVRYPLAIIGTVFLVVIAVLLMFLGQGDKFNWGGIISKMFGKDKDSNIQKANKIPDDRPQDKEVSDENGYKQKEVDQLKENRNPFRDKSKLEVGREDGSTEKIQLPEGVKDKDVEKVYEVRPGEFEVKVKGKPDSKDLDSLKDALLVLGSITLVTAVSFPAHAQDCPEGKVCLTEQQAQDLREIVDHRECMDQALETANDRLSFRMDPYTVLVTKEGQVFAKDKITAHLKWCDYDLEFRADPNLEVKIREKDPDEMQWGFRPRVRLGMLFHPTRIGKEPFQSLLSPALLFEPFHVGLVHFEVHAGMRSFGLGAGIDITRNMDIYGGAAVFWTDPLPVKPTVGLSLSFN